MEFRVKLEDFDGPLDLMLHLIRENKLDIFNLNMHILADQYIAFIQSMEHMHLDIASEYIEELSALLEYKSRKLLPRNENTLDENYEEDQRQKLISRLLEYQTFKEAAAWLQEKQESRAACLSREKASMAQSWSQVQEVSDPNGFHTSQLSQAMLRVLKRHALLQPYETRVSVKEISIEEQMEKVYAWLDAGLVSFDQIVQKCSSLHETIVSFLAVLAGIHENRIQFHIEENGDIWLKKKEVCNE